MSTNRSPFPFVLVLNRSRCPYPAPNAIQQTVNTHELKLVPRAPVKREEMATGASWGENPDAE